MGNTPKETYTANLPHMAAFSPRKLGQYEVFSPPKIGRHKACAPGWKTNPATPLRLGRHEVSVSEPTLHQSVPRLGRHDFHAPRDIPLQTTPMLGPYKVCALGNIPSQTVPMLGSYEVSEPVKTLQQTIPMMDTYKCRKSPKAEIANAHVKHGSKKVNTYLSQVKFSPYVRP